MRLFAVPDLSRQWYESSFGYVKVLTVSGCSSESELTWRILDSTYTVVVTIVVNQENTMAIFANVTSGEIDTMGLNVTSIIDGCIRSNVKVNVGFETHALVFFMGQPEDGKAIKFPDGHLSGRVDNREPGDRMYIELVNSTGVNVLQVTGSQRHIYWSFWFEYESGCMDEWKIGWVQLWQFCRINLTVLNQVINPRPWDVVSLTHWDRDEMDNISHTTFSNAFFNENVWISIKISLKFVPNRPINNIPALVQIMAWRRSGDKPLSEPMMVCLLTHICVTRPQWVKRTTTYCV